MFALDIISYSNLTWLSALVSFVLCCWACWWSYYRDPNAPFWTPYFLMISVVLLPYVAGRTLLALGILPIAQYMGIVRLMAPVLYAMFGVSAWIHLTASRHRLSRRHKAPPQPSENGG